MPEPAEYMATVETAFLLAEVIAEYTIVSAKANTDDGYVRIRATLSNGDFFEVAAYFVIAGNRILTEDYHYQWMDGQRANLRRRWDNTPHHPGIAGFPHHCHVNSEENVMPGEPLSVLQVLAFLEEELAS